MTNFDPKTEQRLKDAAFWIIGHLQTSSPKDLPKLVSALAYCKEPVAAEEDIRLSFWFLQGEGKIVLDDDFVAHLPHHEKGKDLVAINEFKKLA
jgi:hypothetical protein